MVATARSNGQSRSTFRIWLDVDLVASGLVRRVGDETSVRRPGKVERLLGHLDLAGPVRLHDPEIVECLIALLPQVHVGDQAAVMRPPVLRDLLAVGHPDPTGAVRIHHEQLHVQRLDEILRDEAGSYGSHCTRSRLLFKTLATNISSSVMRCTS